MVQRTPKFNLPYVEGTDTVISYPTTSQELATTLDAKITWPLQTVVPTWGTVGTTEAVLMNATSAAMGIPSGTLIRVHLSGIRADSSAALQLLYKIRADSATGTILSLGAVVYAATQAQYPNLTFLYRTTTANQITVLTGVTTAGTCSQNFTNGALIVVERLPG